MSIPYYVGGSVANSYYGSWRRTQDVDVILAVRPDHIRALAKQLAQDYDIDAGAWIDSFRHSQPFNMFFQQTFTKIDVMPLQTAHRQEEARRAQPRSLFTGTPPIRLSSAEDTIVAKRKWYQAMGGSKRQWTDMRFYGYSGTCSDPYPGSGLTPGAPFDQHLFLHQCYRPVTLSVR